MKVFNALSKQTKDQIPKLINHILNRQSPKF